MIQPIPLWAGRFKAPEYRGMGDACPAGLFPNVLHPGFCTNVPPAQQGGAAPSSAPVAVPDPVFNPAIVAANNDARFGLQLTPDRTTQEQLAAEAIAEGAARGVPVSCEIVHNTAPAMGPLAASDLWQALCTVAGGVDRQSAAQLIRGNGFQTYATNNGFTLPAVASSGSSTAAPSSPAPASSSTSTAATSSGAPLPVSAASGIINDAHTAVDSLASSIGVPSWVILAAAGAAVFFFMGGKR